MSLATANMTVLTAVITIPSIWVQKFSESKCDFTSTSLYLKEILQIYFCKLFIVLIFMYPNIFENNSFWQRAEFLKLI
jgi:hypothetical protein